MNKQNTIITKREKQIIELLSQGHTAKKVGKILNRSPRTVDAHTRNLCTKLNASNTAHAVSICYEKGILKIGQI